MTLTIELSPEVEDQLRVAAMQAGSDINSYVSLLLKRSAFEPKLIGLRFLGAPHPVSHLPDYRGLLVHQDISPDNILVHNVEFHAGQLPGAVPGEPCVSAVAEQRAASEQWASTIVQQAIQEQSETERLLEEIDLAASQINDRLTRMNYLAEDTVHQLKETRRSLHNSNSESAGQ